MNLKKSWLAIAICSSMASLIVISFGFTISNKISTNKDLITKIFEAVDNVKTLRYNLQCTERIKGKMQHTESKVKLQVSPRKLYLFIRGIEVLWVEGTNKGEALVNPGSFPYINFNLDTYGSLMRKDQHHTINEIGYHYLEGILKEGMRKVGDKLEKYYKVTGEETFNGRECYRLTIFFPDFAWLNYTVKKGENIISISRKLFVSEYMVLENNPKVSGYNDVKEGQVIKVPNAYSKLTILLIDKEYLLPVNNKVFDDKGLFETYEYYDLQVNKPIPAEEFTRYYKEYHF